MSSKSTSSASTKCVDKNDTQLFENKNFNTLRKSDVMCDHATRDNESSDCIIESDSAYNTDNNEDRNEITDDDIAPERAVPSTIQKIFG